MADERNFRSSYYEKVGCRGVEEKKSLEILMKEKPWDKNKLKQFCLRFTVPAAYRNIVWKVLLDILPVYPDSHAYVMQQRTEQYEHLMYAAKLFGRVTEDMPREEVLLQLWMLENEYEEPPVYPETEFNCTEAFTRIAATLFSLYGCSASEEVEVFWLSRRLMELVTPMVSTAQDMAKLHDQATSMLEKEDPCVYGHLLEISALEVLPLTKWFSCCFAGVLDDSSLAKIWDKICSGAPKILSFVAVILVMSLRRTILRATSAGEVAKCVSEFPETCEDVVANKAIELWQYYGAQPQNDQLQLAKK